jgi:hypothetical protein
MIERNLFNIIKDYRCNDKREFFNIDLQDIIRIIEQLAN